MACTCEGEWIGEALGQTFKGNTHEAFQERMVGQRGHCAPVVCVSSGKFVGIIRGTSKYLTS
jgi:hypothetical protein